ncbi:ribosomal protection-like ABC-F family protein [Haloimpatiens sp. FM7330]|uniref:ribosomal protection-like ABC-F family protein n=1 Tax=Haloimpatiens sp. FM7330 TaxID=3298610 RepID=UPI003642D445
MIELMINNVEKYYGAAKILENVNFEVKTGEKVAIVGSNGTGKTTIFKMVVGLESHDSGVISIRKGLTIGYLDQIPIYPENFTVLDVLNKAFEEQIKIDKEMKELEITMKSIKGKELDMILKKYCELQQKLEQLGYYEINQKLSKVCEGLKINDKYKNRYFKELSGGEKTTVVLAKILLENPDILLLDEPTNHLDMESIEWLEEFIKKYKGAVIIISHDRYFLDKVITKIVELEDMKTEVYFGNYSEYVKEKERKNLLQFEAFKDQQKKIKAMEKTIKDLREWGKRADNTKFFRRAESIQKRLDKMNKIEKPKLDKDTIKVNISSKDRSGNEVVVIKDLEKSFNEINILNKINLQVNYGEKVALIGNNGSGKSTIFKILLNEYAADSGIAKLGASVKIGYLPQVVEFPNEEYTILQYFRDKINISEGEAREFLAKFMFYGESVFKKVKNLSGGEKSRLKLCQLMYNDINFLLLDEPTNHLDIESREELEESLKKFEGTILFISHDRYFINTLSNKIFELNNKKIKSYLGNYEYYKQKKLSKKN